MLILVICMYSSEVINEEKINVISLLKGRFLIFLFDFYEFLTFHLILYYGPLFCSEHVFKRTWYYLLSIALYTSFRVRQQLIGLPSNCSPEQSCSC